MTENEKLEFFGDDSIKELVVELWGGVFEASNKLIKDTKIFGFQEIGIIPDPNVHQMINSLALISNMLEIMLTLSQTGQVDTEDTRLIFNAKQQILMMEQIASALNNDDRASYDEAVERLQKQAPI